MRQYFAQAMLPNHPLVDEMCSELGNDSYRFLVILTEMWKEIGEFELTAKILKQRCGVNAQKSERILERLSEYFKRSLMILKILEVEKSLENFQKVEESSGKLKKVQESSTLEGQNPHGSTRDLRVKEIKEKEIDTPLPPKGESEAFQTFWKSYPKKTTKQMSLDYWVKNKLDDQFEFIREGLEVWKTSDQWVREDGKYIPDAIRFLKFARWQDEPQGYKPKPIQVSGTALPGNQITPAHKRQSGLIQL